MPSGVTTTTALALVAGVGVVYTDVATTSTKVGATSGPPSIKTDLAIRNLASEIDGTTNDIALMDVVDRNTVEVGFTVVELTPRVLGLASPGSTSVTASTVTTITPATASSLFVIGQYAKNLKVVWKLGANGTIALVVPVALCTSATFGADNKGIGKLALSFQARLDLTGGTATTDDAPYSWVITPST